MLQGPRVLFPLGERREKATKTKAYLSFLSLSLSFPHLGRGHVGPEALLQEHLIFFPSAHPICSMSTHFSSITLTFSSTLSLSSFPLFSPSVCTRRPLSPPAPSSSSLLVFFWFHRAPSPRSVVAAVIELGPVTSPSSSLSSSSSSPRRCPTTGLRPTPPTTTTSHDYFTSLLVEHLRRSPPPPLSIPTELHYHHHHLVACHLIETFDTHPLARRALHSLGPSYTTTRPIA